MLRYSEKLKCKARRLRKHMTDSERILWSRLRGKQLLGVQFYRQKPIGAYIVDFHFMDLRRSWWLKLMDLSICRAEPSKETESAIGIYQVWAWRLYGSTAEKY